MDAKGRHYQAIKRADGCKLKGDGKGGSDG